MKFIKQLGFVKDSGTSNKRFKRSTGTTAEVMMLEQRVLFSGIGAFHAHFYPAQSAVAKQTVPLVVGATRTASTTLTAPSSLTAALLALTSAQLNWKDNCTTASGYKVVRSTDGGPFSTVASIASSAAVSYIDSALNSGHTYTYEVEAYNSTKTTGASNKSSVIVPLGAPVAPNGLTASAVGSWISLSWSGTGASGYNVLRSTDGVNYSTIAQITSGTTSTYTDSSVTAGQNYSYEVTAYNASGTSAASSPATITAPPASTSNGVAITTRFGNELVITASGAHDSVAIVQFGSTLNISADGQTYTFSVPLAGTFIYTRGGSDSVSIDQSVLSNITLESIDGASTAVNSAGANVSAWIDSSDNYTGTGMLHRVSSFAGGVSKATGASLADPTDSGSVTKINMSLWGTGPVAADVNQGAVGDCYFVSSLAAFAGVKPSVLVNSAVDMGDGTYTVQYLSSGAPTFVRVSNDMPTGGYGGFMFAHPGANQTSWAMVMEKAFAYFRAGANTYASIASGWMNEPYSDLGVSSSNVSLATTESTFFSTVLNDLTNHKAVTFGTFSSAPNLVSGHAYSLVSVSTDSSGVNHYTVRNPWGSSGDSLEDGNGYASLTFAQMVANFQLGCQALS